MNLCLYCSKEFEQAEKGSTYLYCSADCHRAVRAPARKERPVHEAECQLCSRVFTVINRLTAKYCSDKCRSLARYRKLTGFPIKAPRRRSEHGKGYINKYGYRAIYRDHPNANPRTKIILEHIFVMSEFLKRPMRKGETVHHKNGIRSDNRLENLELWTSRHPAGVRHQEAIKNAIALLKEDGYKVSK